MPKSLGYDAQKVVELYHSLRSAYKVAARLGCCTKTVLNYLDKAGQTRVYAAGPRPHVHPANKLNLDEAAVVKAYRYEKNATRVAKIFGCSSPTILDILKRRSVQIVRPKMTKEHLQKLHDGHTRARASGMGAGKRHPGWKGGKKTVRCAQCHKRYKLWPSFVHEHNFCSQDCSAKWSSINRRGAKAGGWKGGTRVIRVCEHCGVSYETWRKRGAGRFCSALCFQEWYRCVWKQWRVEHPRERYPHGWTETLKREIRDRDEHICVLCGKPETKCRRNLSVHHIDYDKENLDPENLASLCDDCHGQVNGDREFWTEWLGQLMSNHPGRMSA